MEPVGSADATALLRGYLLEIIGRYWGRPSTEEEVDAELADGEDYRLDLLLVARVDGVAVGCAGLRRVDAGTVELKRVFVRQDRRGRGGGAALLEAVERAAAELGAGTIRLDTRKDLVEARALYARHGYAEVPAFSEGPYADHWFVKRLH
ncbi:putative N-acetyltransferase YhbS [Umezawaea tangerina]|uniref:Putative N-acetyltransferase YhbS n=1 Tax=Umezawaea tangerina TaxID=84725 RepID=A0A2T0T4V8_9PSEU|nr:putative N-acetyltransferase YhbS [Umezawaea tangerina]